ncbi:hypothetical protein [Otariodibacter oris]|uniref:Uncharacterized protein n=1 Tax=Otariodibacter oris TaxID=1032623 RepID=A0A420XHL9_9PAST|nr:hypothetical protein [Otariodibacter oris]QGM80974.1 hypothetical protein A6A10_05930 [Otariodibacter oris]RKR76847.1 hypothetical protein DES31_0155 [Otariodibacter oris]
MAEQLYTLKEEQELNEKLQALFDEWKSYLEDQDSTSQYIKEGLFIRDGFYPSYTQQKGCKVLFIGRECRSLGEKDYSVNNYIDILFDAYRGNEINEKSVESYNFHRRLFCFAWALKYYALSGSLPEWENIPSINPDESTLLKDFGTDKLSFAFMNFSKFSNNDENYEANIDLMEAFSQATMLNSTKNFYTEEITLLDPDVIITMNLERDWLSRLGNIVESSSKDPNVTAFKMDFNGKVVPVFDCYHFSAIKSNIEGYYDPFRKAYLEYQGKTRNSNE